jgi:NhaP-type Na+/H+ or K+/H+ antiporter
MSFPTWALIIGSLLIVTALSSTLLKRLPANASMIYLAVGYALGPNVWNLLNPDPLRHSAVLEVLSEMAVLISLFSVGLKLGLPLSNSQWGLPVRLAGVSMLLTIIFISGLAFFVLGLPLGAAILLGSILAPTDPVLASDVQVEEPDDRDRLRFSLSGEGGLNDGAAFPFVMLGLGLLGLHELGEFGWRWLAVDVLWAVIGGLAIGAILGTWIGKLVVYLRIRHQEAIGLDEFLSLGLVALTYGVALYAATYGFLAVFAAGLALQRIKQRPTPPGDAPVGPAGLQDKEAHIAVATDPALAGPYMMQAVRGFNGQLERIAELAMVLMVGAMLAHVRFSWDVMWFLPVLFLLLRPLAVWLGLLGAAVSGQQRLLISWFGIRGIGSIYYLTYAIRHGLDPELAEPIIAVTLASVAASIIVHGISVTPLMNHYMRRTSDRRVRNEGGNRRHDER